MKFEIKQYQENKQSMEKTYKTIKDKKDKYHKDLYKVDTDYREQERKLLSIKYKKRDKIEQDNKEESNKYDKILEPKKELNQQYKRIINLRKLIPKVLKLDEYKVYKYGYQKRADGLNDYGKNKIPIYYNPTKILEQNEFLKMSCFIIENDKPKNKYSLIVVGNSFFCNRLGESDKLLNNNVYSYGVDTHTDNANIRIGIKDFPTIKLAEEYINRNSHKFIKEFRQEHNKIIEEYKEVIENTNTTEWKIAVLEDEKYYYEHNYSHGEEEPRYKEVVKEIEQLTRCLK